MSSHQDNVQVTKIALIGIVGAVITYAIGVCLTVMYYRMKDKLEAEKGTGSKQAAAIQIRADQRKELESWGWIDREKGIVRMPIDRAMQLLVKRGLSQWPSASSTPTERRH